MRITSETTVQEIIEGDKMKRNCRHGWSNYATWALILWARNDEKNYRKWQAIGKYYTRENNTHYKLASLLQEWLPKKIKAPDLQEDDWDTINWDEVAEACFNDAVDEMIGPAFTRE